MTISPVADRYARAYFQLAREKDMIDRLQEELLEFRNLLRQEPDLQRILFHPRVKESDKKSVLKKVLPDFHPLTLNLFFILVDKNRFTILNDLVECFGLLKKEHNNQEVVLVHAARPLPQRVQKALEEKLQKSFGKEIELRVIIDEKIIGGLVLQVGDELIDGSIRRSLEKLKERLQGIQVSQLGVSES